MASTLRNWKATSWCLDMSFQCQSCGSKNHATFDCPKPDSAWRDKVPGEVARVLEPSPAVETRRRDRVEIEPVDAIYESPNGLSGRLPRRKNFPFLRESTRRAIAERIRRMQSGGREEIFK